MFKTGKQIFFYRSSAKPPKIIFRIDAYYQRLPLEVPKSKHQIPIWNLDFVIWNFPVQSTGVPITIQLPKSCLTFKLFEATKNTRYPDLRAISLEHTNF